MKAALWKATLITLSVVLFSVGTSLIIGFISGGMPGIIALSLSIVIPTITAFPSLLYIFVQHSKLSDAYAQLEKPISSYRRDLVSIT